MTIKKKSPSPHKPAAAARALYLYGFSPHGASSTAQVVAMGVDGNAPVEPLEMEKMIAWVSRVSRREFAEELSQRMEDLEWLAETGVRHQRAVTAIAAKATILPARFGTVFLAEDSLAAHAREQKPLLQKGFERVKDCDEWGVKVFAERPAHVAVRASSGSDYLKQKSSALKAQTQSNAADEAVQQFAAELARLAREAAPAGKVSGGERGLMWQASFLLPRAKQAQWDSVLKKWATHWGDERRIEATGPWPPYSFV